MQLAVGQTHVFRFDTPVNSVSAPNFYMDIPTGVTFRAYNTALGGRAEMTADWTADDSANPRRFINDSQYPGVLIHTEVDITRT